MTRMIPPYPAESANKTEGRIFSVIEKSPGTENWVCLHSVGLARHKRKRYGEADFIIICPRGVFCLEAKGGEVKRSDGVWTIGWPGRSYTSNEGPFKQSQGTIHPLMDEISGRLGATFKRKVPVGWGVVFPDIVFEINDPEWDLDIVCDSKRIAGFSEYVESLAQYTRQRELSSGRKYPEFISTADIEHLVGCFRKDFDLVPKVGDLIRRGHEELAELSAQQYTILRYVLDPGNPRVLCPGQAGTGKTMLALEAARRLANEGQSVLLICFNRLLGSSLRHEVSSFANLITASSAHSYMYSVIKKAGLIERLNELENDAHGKADFYNETYSEVFEEAVLHLMDEDRFRLFDTLIIDEGQDVLFSPLIDALGLTLSGGLDRGRWSMFYDPGLQSELYGRLNDTVLETLRNSGAATLPLFENFRNPENFVDEMCILTGSEKPTCMRILPVKVEYKSYETEKEQAKRLRALLIDLIRDGVETSSISILSGRSANDSSAVKFPPEIGKNIVHLADELPVDGGFDAITASSVSGYKGLENDVIILTDLPVPSVERLWDSSILYVGMTRARTKLYALVNEEFLSARFSGEFND